MRFVCYGIIVGCVWGLSSTVAEAGPNAAASLPMHAVLLAQAPADPCDIPDPCQPGPPRVDIPPGAEVTVHVLLRNYDHVQGVQTAFDWGDWEFLGATWSCQALQAVAAAPDEAGGADHGTISTLFDGITGGATAVIGSMRFVAGASGCLTQIESAWPDGTHVLGSANEVTRVLDGNRGAVCVGGGGVNACEPALAEPGPNGAVTLPLHAVVESASDAPSACEIEDPCEPGPPRVMVPENRPFFAAYLMMRNYTEVRALQTAFDWGDWTYLGANWTCLPHAMFALQPEGSGGARDGTLTLAFDAISGGETAVLGSMFFVANSPGCLTQVESAYEGGTHIVDLAGNADPMTVERRGSICIGESGLNACGPPLAAPGGPYAAHEGTDLRFDGSASTDLDGIIVDYAWQFGDGTTGSGSNPTHAFAPGVYRVTLTVVDNDGYASSRATWAHINALPVCNLIPAEPLPRAVGVEIVFGAHGSYDADGRIVRYEWEFGDGTTGFGSRFPHAYRTPATYTVTLRVTDDDGGSSICQTSVEIVPNARPECDAGGPYAAGVSAPVTFDGRASFDPDGRIESYRWDFGDGAIGQGPTAEHRYEQGCYTATLCVYDDLGARSCCSAEVFIACGNDPPPRFPTESARFVSFEGMSAEAVVQLDWQITTKSRDLSFTVLRREAEALDFIALPSSRHEIAADDDGAYSFIDPNVVVGRRYAYAIEVDDPAASEPIRSDTVWITVLPRSDADPELHPNQPNPFNPSTTIRFMVSNVGDVRMRIFDMNGRLVRTLLDRGFEPGEHTIEWDGRDDSGRAASSGVYVYRLETRGTVLSRRMVLIR